MVLLKFGYLDNRVNIMFALINEEYVLQVEKKKFDVAEPFKWVEIPKGLQPKNGWKYVNEVFVEPEQPVVTSYQVDPEIEFNNIKLDKLQQKNRLSRELRDQLLDAFLLDDKDALIELRKTFLALKQDIKILQLAKNFEQLEAIL